jgi:hypothetical protein
MQITTRRKPTNDPKVVRNDQSISVQARFWIGLLAPWDVDSQECPTWGVGVVFKLYQSLE